MLQIRTTNAFLKGMLGILAVCTVALGPLAMFNLYFMPYWINVVWLDIVTYLHHHGPEDETEKVPWYRGEVCMPLSTGRQCALVGVIRALNCLCFISCEAPRE